MRTWSHMRYAEICALSFLVVAGCAHRQVTVVTDPPGALVGLYPMRKAATVSPGALRLKAGTDYTVQATLEGYETTYAAVPAAPGFNWPFPINMIIQAQGGYDSTVSIALRPCTRPDGCREPEGMRQYEERRPQ